MRKAIELFAFEKFNKNNTSNCVESLNEESQRFVLPQLESRVVFV